MKAQDYLDQLMNGDTAGFTEGMQGGVTLLIRQTEKSAPSEQDGTELPGIQLCNTR